MDKTFHAWGNLYECSVVGYHDYLAGDMVANLQVLVESVPRMRSKLLQTKGDALLLVVEVENDDVDLLVQLDNLVWVADTAPGEVGDVYESVYAAKVDKHTVGGDVFDRAFVNLALLHLADDFLLLCLKFGLDECLVRDNNVAELLVDFHNLELHGLAHEYVVVADGMHVDLAAGEECLDAEYVDNHTTLRAALDETSDNLLVVEGGVDALPTLAQASLLVGKNQLTFLVFLIFYVNLYDIANLQVGVVAEFAGGDDTVALVTNVDNDFFLVKRDYFAINNLMLAHFVEGLVIGLLEVFFVCSAKTAIFILVPVEIVQGLYALSVFRVLLSILLHTYCDLL